MFFWVLGLRTNLPSITLKDAIRNFVKNNGFLTDEEMTDAKLASLSVEYERVYKEYMDEYKQEQRKKE